MVLVACRLVLVRIKFIRQKKITLKKPKKVNVEKKNNISIHPEDGTCELL